MDEQEIKALLLEQDEEFRKIFSQHQECEKKLEEFKRKSFLTENEELEEKAIKKQKLLLKDRMYHSIAEFRKSLG